MVLRYCQDDIDKARNKIEELRQINRDLKEYQKFIKFTDEERNKVLYSISILNDILNYCDSLSDKKIDKIIKMKRIVRESDK